MRPRVLIICSTTKIDAYILVFMGKMGLFLVASPTRSTAVEQLVSLESSLPPVTG